MKLFAVTIVIIAAALVPVGNIAANGHSMPSYVGCADESSFCISEDTKAGAMPLGCLVSCLFSQAKNNLISGSPTPFVIAFAAIVTLLFAFFVTGRLFIPNRLFENWIAGRHRATQLFGITLLN